MNLFRKCARLAALTVVAGTCAFAFTSHSGLFAASADTAVNKACPISGEALEADAPTATYDGTTYGFCCRKCVGKFEAMKDEDKRSLVAKLAPAPAADATKPAAVDEKKAELTAGTAYALGVCPMSGEKLDKDAVRKVIDGREVRFCCDNCAAKFEKDTAKGFAKVDELIVKQQGDAYPLDTCVISGEKLGGMGDPINVVVGNRLVKVCCKSCVRKVNADPAKAFVKLDAAIKEKQTASYPLDVCVIAGDALTEGEPIDIIIANRLVRLCCDHCVVKAVADAAGTLAKLDEAAAKKK